jgi:hypothetical protein
MPEPFLGDLRMDSGLEHVRRVSVPEIMEADMFKPAPS